MQSSDFAGQGHLTPFSTGQLMAYKIKVQTMQLNSTFHFDSSRDANTARWQSFTAQYFTLPQSVNTSLSLNTFVN